MRYIKIILTVFILLPKMLRGSVFIATEKQKLLDLGYSQEEMSERLTKDILKHIPEGVTIF